MSVMAELIVQFLVLIVFIAVINFSTMMRQSCVAKAQENEWQANSSGIWVSAEGNAVQFENLDECEEKVKVTFTVVMITSMLLLILPMRLWFMWNLKDWYLSLYEPAKE